MSLTSALLNPSSPVTLFFRQHFPDTKNLSKVWRDAVLDLPCREPPLGQEKPEWSAIGRALDYRLRLYLQSYAAAETVAFMGAKVKIGPLSYGPLVRHIRFQVEDILRNDPDLRSDFLDIWEELRCLWDELSIAHGGKTEFLDNEVESRISALCLIFGYFEERFRSIITPTILFSAFVEKWTAERLIKNLRKATVDDVCQLSTLFLECSSKIFDFSSIFLNPIFRGSNDVGGADADFIAGKCLWDIKTTIKPSTNFQKWPYQLLGYSLLDYDDQFKLTSVGIYLSRQGSGISWKLNELIKILGGDTKIPINEWRIRFRGMLKQKNDGAGKSTPAKATKILRGQ